jgi:hypothetical protein
MPPKPAVPPTPNAIPPAIRKNVIIRTMGLSGNSVLSGLIGRAGYWTGEDTFKKEYDTDLIVNSEKALAKLNPYLETALTLDDLKAIYTGRLYRMPRSRWNFAKAVAI